MTRMELHAYESAAHGLFRGRRSLAGTLILLLKAGGAAIPVTAIAEVRRWRTSDERSNHDRYAKVMVCLLRQAMWDVGMFGSDIVTHGKAYALPEPGRSRVIERLRQEIEG